VQYEYGLYGERYKPLERRPSTFKSRDGKEIQVQQNVAQHNDITLKRGAVCIPPRIIVVGEMTLTC
jgi:exonuclease V